MPLKGQAFVPESAVWELLRLLPRDLNRKFAVEDAGAEIFCVARGGFFAVGCGQLRNREKQRCLRQAIAVNAFMRRFNPRVVQISKRELFLFVVRERFAGNQICCRRRHFIFSRPSGVPVRSQTSMRELPAKIEPLGTVNSKSR
jgi:hypothetical protein